MKRRQFITLLGGAAAWPLAARAQQPKKTPRLCFLTFDPGTLQSRSPRFDPFFESLRDLGYADEQTIAIDYLSADGRGERFPALAAECLLPMHCGQGRLATSFSGFDPTRTFRGI